MKKKEPLPVTDFAALTGLYPSTAYALVQVRRVEAVKEGGIWKVDRDSARAYAEKRQKRLDRQERKQSARERLAAERQARQAEADRILVIAS